MEKVHQASYKSVDYTRETKFIDPYVKKIDSMNQMVEVWRFTRPYLKLDDIEKDVKALETIDLPMNGMKSYIFELRTSTLFRDLLYTMRPIASAWARSLRTVQFNQDNLFFSSEYKDISDKNAKRLQDGMKKVYKNLYDGLGQDDARGEMPMAIATEYTINIDDRTLISFLKLLKLHSKPLYDIYGKLFLHAIGREEDYINNRNTTDIFNKFSISKKEYKAVKDNDNSYTGHILDTVAGFYKLQTRLAAQFIRQHYSTIKNELFNYVDEDTSIDKLSTLDEDSEIVVGVYANENSYKKTLRNRTAWFAQWDHESNASWSLVLKSYVKDMTPEEFMEFTRSQNGKNVYFHDVWANVTGQAVMPPDPFLLEMPELIDIRKSMMNSDSTIFHKWEEMRDAGLINDNPDNKFRKIYEKFLKTKEPQVDEEEPDPEYYEKLDNY